MGETLRAFLDASVLYPVSLRNLLMRLAIDDVYQARWSMRVHEEWIRAVLRDKPAIPEARLHEVRDGMDAHAADAMVTGFEPLIDGLVLPDPDDRHMLAAAIVCGANVIVTRNLRDFPRPILDPFNIEAQHPDEFIRHLVDTAPGAVIDAVTNQQARLRNPVVPMPDLLSLFERLGLAETVDALRRLMPR
jgi:predicted nucleic acid-binding protein